MHDNYTTHTHAAETRKHTPHVSLFSQFRPHLSSAALHGLAGEVVKAIEPHTEADPAALLAQFLVAFGNVAGRSAHFITEADEHYTNLFAVVVGASADARKGSSWGHIRWLWSEARPTWAEQIVSGLASGEGLISHARVAKDSPIMVVESEFASTLISQRRRGSILSTTLRHGWDHGNLEVIRRDNPEKVRGAHISIVAHITNAELKHCLQKVDTLNGFGNRFLWIHAERSKLLSRGGTFRKQNNASLVLRLQDAAEFASRAGELRRDEKADALWDKLYAGFSVTTEDEHVAPILARAAPQVMRLAVVYALLDHSLEVRCEHLEAGLAVWNYSAATARQLFSKVERDNKTAQRILTALEERADTGMTQTEISSLFGRHKSAEEIQHALLELQEAGLAVATKEESTGRRTTRWYATKGHAKLRNKSGRPM